MRFLALFILNVQVPVAANNFLISQGGIHFPGKGSENAMVDTTEIKFPFHRQAQKPAIKVNDVYSEGFSIHFFSFFCFEGGAFAPPSGVPTMPIPLPVRRDTWCPSGQVQTLAPDSQCGLPHLAPSPLRPSHFAGFAVQTGSWKLRRIAERSHQTSIVSWSQLVCLGLIPRLSLPYKKS